ncbi:hypothetical protein BU15DRAFT_68218 [Melanogaster broomeanus]|nr:hypothetical protein BU15DRAFT_68218 [Melanogaster broomeanus]
MRDDASRSHEPRPHDAGGDGEKNENGRPPVQVGSKTQSFIQDQFQFELGPPIEMMGSNSATHSNPTTMQPDALGMLTTTTCIDPASQKWTSRVEHGPTTFANGPVSSKMTPPSQKWTRSQTEPLISKTMMSPRKWTRCLKNGPATSKRIPSPQK